MHRAQPRLKGPVIRPGGLIGNVKAVVVGYGAGPGGSGNVLAVKGSNGAGGKG